MGGPFTEVYRGYVRVIYRIKGLGFPNIRRYVWGPNNKDYSIHIHGNYHLRAGSLGFRVRDLGHIEGIHRGYIANRGDI